RYGLSYEEAGNAKRNGSVPDGYKIDILDPFKQAMVQQISRALQLFSLSSASRDITSIILAGGCASIEEIDQTVENSLNIKTYIANPFSMSVSNKKDSNTHLKASMAKRLSKDAPTLVIACGLALRSFD
ncbi:MAG: pilus assembly protein PilM, partial [Methylococcales bacterium]|nr:pilus assembly protein PilM [Methylococcales bacterium]